ncbi:MAG: hypothetical protein M1833_006683 [Piccolia ochrophora]|nr:MAG: hypothetical protein M1833_006683 [Piccolia ochrophora]
MVDCPICGKPVKEANINRHIDSGCNAYLEGQLGSANAQTNGAPGAQKTSSVSSFFQPSTSKRAADGIALRSPPPAALDPPATPLGQTRAPDHTVSATRDTKRPLDHDEASVKVNGAVSSVDAAPSKRQRSSNAFQQAAPLAERMRPRTLEEVCGQELVGPHGVLRGLIEQDRVPSMILWGGAGTGKTTIARVISHMVGSRFVEMNSTSVGVQDCKKIFAEAKSELGLTGRKTIFFLDEIHRFTKAQQDIFLGPVESGQITLIGATTENPSFKVQNALLSRCRTFTLQQLTAEDIVSILERALEKEGPTYKPSDLVDTELIKYLAAFSDGDARTALNLFELAMGLSNRPNVTKESIKQSLTKTLVYDRAGDQHFDTISAFHKSIRGSDPDAALYYLARMLQSGEDALYIARRLVVVASEDIGLADNSMLSLATAAYAAAEKVGMPEARINLAHATVAISLSPKSTRAYRGLANANAALREPGVAGLPIPVHLRNAPTKMMREMGYGKEYKYNPNYKDGKVSQQYLPTALHGRTFLEDIDLGTKIDSDTHDGD